MLLRSLPGRPAIHRSASHRSAPHRSAPHRWASAHLRSALGGLSGALLLLALVSCGGEEGPGIARLEMYHHATPDTAGNIPEHNEPGFRRFTNSSGFEVTLTQAYLVVSAVELLPLSAPNRPAPGFGGLDWILPAAHAHGIGSDTRLADPTVIDLLAPDAVGRVLGELQPPHGYYTAARVTLAPADDDAAFLPDDFDMVGHTVRLVGTMIQAPDTLGFGYVFDLADSLEVLFTPANGGPRTFGHDRTTPLPLATIYDTWFQGVNPRTMSFVEREARIQLNILTSFGVHADDGTHGHAPGLKGPTAP